MNFLLLPPPSYSHKKILLHLRRYYNTIIMKHFALLLLAAISIPTASGNPYVISDDRIRSMDITPVLGRGYSIMTNSFQSTCLQVSETTIPSYNYDCKCDQLLQTVIFILYPSYDHVSNIAALTNSL